MKLLITLTQLEVHISRGQAPGEPIANSDLPHCQDSLGFHRCSLKCFNEKKNCEEKARGKLESHQGLSNHMEIGDTSSFTSH